MRTPVSAATLIGIASVLVIAGCGGDSGSEANPVTAVSISPDAMDIEVAHSRELTATVSGSNKNLTWYVNDIENGSDIVGEISENSPVTYTAPNWLPSPSTVLIKAVSHEDTTLYDSCAVNITFNKLFVDADNGNDSNNGCMNLPLKTITHAMSETDSGTTVVVFPGVYDSDNGEDFPINMGIGRGVTLVGMDWENCIIRGRSDIGSMTTVSVSGWDCRFRKFTVEPGPPVEIIPHITISVGGTGNMVDSVRTSYRADYFLRVQGSTDVTLQNNYFVVDDGERLKRGIEIVFNNSGTIIRNCTVSGYFTGIFFNQDEDALVEGCVLEGNDYGAELCCFESETSNPNPDFGGGARGSVGGNRFANNASCGLYNPTYNVIFAKYNTWDNDPPVAGEDYCNTSTGGVVIE
ncbi:MAG: DUF1565 domain-containing protein [bacterium]|jgi:hypothetical protein